MKDYSHRYSGRTSSRQNVYGKRPGGKNGGRLWKTIGVVVTVAMISGVMASVGFGVALRNGLSQLADSRKENSQLYAQNRVLLDRRDQLEKEERILKAAAEIGLFPPNPDQVRHP
jgi:hypothetical protein